MRVNSYRNENLSENTKFDSNPKNRSELVSERKNRCYLKSVNP